MHVTHHGSNQSRLRVTGLALAALVASLLTFVGTGTSPVDAAAGGRTADFNGDGFDDLAIGAPGDNVSGRVRGGSVNVIYGSADGVSPNGVLLDQILSQNSRGVGEVVETDDRFGSALAIGDFNNDGRDDLAIGVPGESVNGKNGAGAVNVIYGSAGGLKALGGARGDQVWTQDTPRVNGVAQPNGFFGTSLAVGDFNDDGRDDLAIGATGVTVGGRSGAGAVHVIYGSGSGLTAGGPRIDQQWTQNSSRVGGVPQTNGLFGFALASGDLNRDGSDDLIIGASNMNVSGRGGAGAVHVIYGSNSGVSASAARSDQYWTQATPRVGGTPQTNDHFGGSVAAGDLNGDNFDDLIVGVPFEEVRSANSAGAVHVIYGSPSGASTTRTRSDQYWTQNSSGVNEVAEPFDRFGWSVAAGDYNGDNFDDLTIGARAESLGSANEAGGVHVIYGSSSGASSTSSRPDQFWEQDVGGINDSNETPDNLGWSVAAADFNNDGREDLIAGAPRESTAGFAQSGSVHVIYGNSAGLSASATRPDQAWTRAVARVEGAPGDGDNFGLAIGG